MDKITAVIITHNEERNIGRCLESLEDIADEVVVVDSGSTDRTEQICNDHAARFVHHDWEGFAKQKNYANSLADNPWILSLDADEALSDELRATLSELKEKGLDKDTVYIVNRLNNYCGKWVRHCGWHPDYCARLWKKNRAHWYGMVHESLIYGENMRQQHLAGDLLHYTYYTKEEHQRKTLRYSLLGAEEAFIQGRKGRFTHIVFKPIWTFIRNYIFFGGFLDGRTGFHICRMSASYTLLKYSKLYELSHDKEKKRKILLDLSVLRHPYCGLGQVAKNYARHFQESTTLQQEGFEVTLLVPPSMVGAFGDKVRYLPSRRIYRLLPWLMPYHNVWHSIHQMSNYRPGHKSTRRILTIHDLNFLYEKTPLKQRKYRHRIQREVNDATTLCFISNFAQQEAEKNLKIGKQAKIVISNGVENLTKGQQSQPIGIDFTKPFFLSIGVVRPKKNIHTLFPMMDMFPDHQLIIAGDDGGNYAQELREQLKAHPNIRIIGTVDDAQRRWLYAHCTALLFPSLLEGFGLPVVEAMQWGKPVCCSTSTCLPEIGGEHAFFFPSFTPEAMATTIREALKTFTAERAAAEKAYAASFSYERHFKEYENIYLRLGR